MQLVAFINSVERINGFAWLHHLLILVQLELFIRSTKRQLLADVVLDVTIAMGQGSSWSSLVLAQKPRVADYDLGWTLVKVLQRPLRSGSHSHLTQSSPLIKVIKTMLINLSLLLGELTLTFSHERHLVFITQLNRLLALCSSFLLEECFALASQALKVTCFLGLGSCPQWWARMSFSFSWCQFWTSVISVRLFWQTRDAGHRNTPMLRWSW